MYKHIIKTQEAATKKYSPVFGTRVRIPEGEFELTDVNNLGIPYFSKVVRNKVQKKQYTLSLYHKDWLDEQLGLKSFRDELYIPTGLFGGLGKKPHNLIPC